MNQNLQTILNFIQQDENLSIDEKNAILKSLKDADKELEITTFKLDRTEKVKKTTAILLEKTIEELEQKRKAVEAQNRELEIESSLERVRTVAMAMQKPDDLLSICEILFIELKKLGFSELRNAMINIHDDDKGSFLNYDYSDVAGKTITDIFYNSHPVIENHVKQIKSANDAFAQFAITGDELESWKEFRKRNGELDDPRLKNIKAVYYFFYSISKGDVGISNFIPVTPEQLGILKRFRNVFDLAYRRYMDVALAEAQARESQIQLALERVRARTMAMHRSEELSETVYILFQQFNELGENPDQATIGIINEDEWVIEYWVTMYGNQMNRVFKFSIDEPNVTNKIYKAWKEQRKSLVIELSGKELYDFATYRASMGGAVYNETENRRVINVAFFSKGLVNVQSNESRSAESVRLLERFATVFEQTYIRFLDLQKAEAQAREAQIQLALERVRARTMAMYDSSELSQAAALLFDQLKQLGAELWAVGFAACEKDNLLVKKWISIGSSVGQLFDPIFMPYNADHEEQKMYDAWKNQVDLYEEVQEGDELRKIYEHFMEIPSARVTLQKTIDSGISLPVWQKNHVASYKYGYLLIITTKPFEETQIFKRFAKVFEQTYTRFLDLQKAEAQSKEAQTEAALERVRSRSMGMQKSEELREVIQVVYEQFVHINILVEHAGFIMDYKERDDMFIWLADKHAVPFQVTIPYFDSAHWNSFIEAKEKGLDFFANHLSFEEKNRFYQDLFKLIPGVPEETLEYYFSCPGLAISTVLLDNVCLYIENFSGTPYTDEENNTLMRFGKVFQQTYTRFLDLQKAEAQTREAQIEAALEKVRSRSLAMHRSDELEQVVASLFDRLVELGMSFDGAAIYLFEKEKRNVTLWVASRVSAPLKVNLPYDAEISGNLINQDLWNAIEKGEDIINKSYSGKIKNDYYLYVGNNNKSKISEQIRTMMMEAESWTVSFAAEKNCVVGIDSWAGRTTSDEDFKIVKRFTKVFEQSYTRFLDLQKAEAQAREAKIETSLERVRSKAMSMHSSKDLADTIVVFYHEVELLSSTPRRCGVGLIDKETHNVELSAMSTTEQGESIETIGKLKLTGHPILEGIYDNWILQKEYHPVLRGNEIKKYYQLIRPQIAYPDYPTDTAQYGYFFFFNEGGVYAWTEKELSEDELKIYRRFTSVLSLTYKRYKDLKDAEANAREAIKRASLDRVRAETASMRTTGDLERITPLIWNELTTLGVPFIRCGVFIMDEQQEQIHSFLSTPDGKAIAAFHLRYDTPGNISLVLSHWQKKEKYVDHWDEKAFTEFAGTLLKQGALASPEQYLKTLPKGGFYLHFIPFLQGMLYVGNTTQLGEEEIKLIQSLADAFSTAYARYEDFNKLEAAKQQVEKTLVDLKQAQAQLVQSEKMASLGELTAGIAHEIQNPLNFVNNFSEVSNELIDEMNDELNKGDINEAKAIANDIKQNLEKINHHGKRADAIVKGMLQHSRSSSATKEPTDINKLADEYLRLAYHGLRAKDKSFNATLKTDYDESIGNINVIPQDIGRVILNLIINAFYAVTEKKNQQLENYEPMVSVSTKKINDKVEIRIGDNGNGIPEKVLSKIFQPFFTTKPTGQGTGLGLSLSYDIMKAHAGDLKVESKEGGGAEFIIKLPLD